MPKLIDMVTSVVYPHVDGLPLTDIVDALEKQYEIRTTTREVLQVIKQNPGIFTEVQGRIQAAR